MSFRQAVAKFCKGLPKSAGFPARTCNYLPNTGKPVVSAECDFGGHTWSRYRREAFQWVFLYGQAAIILGSYSIPSLSEDVSTKSSSKNDEGILDNIPEEALISNEHTSKWRVFTDCGKDYFVQGNLEQAEKFFLSAIQEAREGFGERDPHVASACNNLAELYRVKKDYATAEPLYVEAVDILEEYFGTNDIRVGAALHNLGQFYFVLRKLDNARECHEIKRRVLGEFHVEVADTMHHLATVLYLQGKEKESMDLTAASIEILEAGGLGESASCVRRMQLLAQRHAKSNQFAEAEILWRKILHVLESTKGWTSLNTIVAAEQLALSILTVGKLREAEELLQRCLEARKTLLPAEHIQVAANELFIARAKLLISKQIIEIDSSQAMTELDMAKSLLHNSIRVAQQVLVRLVEKKGQKEPTGQPRKTEKEAHLAVLILLQSLNALGLLEILKLEFVDSKESIPAEAAVANRQCISTYKEFESQHSIGESSQIKAEYLSCLKLFVDLMSKGMTKEKSTEKEIKEEIQRIEGELLRARKA